MLEIKVEIEKQEAQNYMESHGNPCDISDKLIMCAYDGEELEGVGAVSMTLQSATLEAVCCESELELAMGKALLNLIDLSGIEKVYCYHRSLYPLAKRLGFQENKTDDGLELDLAGYFTAGCHSN